jgi:hypothetical protein
MTLVAFDEPLRSSSVLTITNGMVICGWIWWRLPFPKAFLQLDPCGLVRNWIISEGDLTANSLHRLLRSPLLND